MAHPGAGQEPLTGPTGPVRAREFPTYPAEQGLGFARLVSLSDGVFAIALTLLAIDVRLPELAPEQVDSGLPAAVLELAAVLAPFSPPVATFLLALLFVVAVPLGHFYYRALLRISGACA